MLAPGGGGPSRCHRNCPDTRLATLRPPRIAAVRLRFPDKSFAISILAICLNAAGKAAAGVAYTRNANRMPQVQNHGPHQRTRLEDTQRVMPRVGRIPVGGKTRILSYSYPCGRAGRGSAWHRHSCHRSSRNRSHSCSKNGFRQPIEGASRSCCRS